MTSKRVQQGRRLGDRRFPRSQIIPDVRPRRTHTLLIAPPPPPVWCTAIYSGIARPGSDRALPGFQHCALRHGHDGAHLVDAWDGERFWYDPSTGQSTFDQPSTVPDVPDA